MPIPLLSQVAATAATGSASRRFRTLSNSSFVPATEPGGDEERRREEEPRQEPPQEAPQETSEDADIKTFAQLLHDAQADARPEDDGAHWPEDSLDPQDLCAFHEEG